MKKVFTFLIIIVAVTVIILLMNKYGGIVHMMTKFDIIKLFKTSWWYLGSFLAAFFVALIIGIKSHIRKKRRLKKERRTPNV